MLVLLLSIAISSGDSVTDVTIWILRIETRTLHGLGSGQIISFTRVDARFSIRDPFGHRARKRDISFMQSDVSVETAE